jgi:hypothetical protein
VVHIAPGRESVSPRPRRCEAHTSHRSFDAAFPGLEAPIAKRLENAWAAIGLAALLEDLTDGCTEFGLVVYARAHGPSRVRVIALPGDSEEPAHGRNRERRLLRVG